MHQIALSTTLIAHGYFGRWGDAPNSDPSFWTTAGGGAVIAVVGSLITGALAFFGYRYVANREDQRAGAERTATDARAAADRAAADTRAREERNASNQRAVLTAAFEQASEIRSWLMVRVFPPDGWGGAIDRTVADNGFSTAGFDSLWRSFADGRHLIEDAALRERIGELDDERLRLEDRRRDEITANRWPTAQWLDELEPWAMTIMNEFLRDIGAVLQRT